MSYVNNPQADFITAKSILEFLRRKWRWLIGSLLFGYLCGFVFFLFVPAKYEAKALFQTARVLNEDVESPQQMLERLKFPTFYGKDQIKACLIESDSPELLLSQNISPVVLKGTSLIQVAYRARSSGLAEHCLIAVMNQIIDIQNQISRPVIQSASHQLEIAKNQLEVAERLQNQLDQRSLTVLDVTDTRFSQSVVLLSAMMNKREEVARLRKSVIEQIANLNPPSTQPAKLVEPIFVSSEPVFPKFLPSVLIGMFAGLVVGGLVFVVRKGLIDRRTLDTSEPLQ